MAAIQSPGSDEPSGSGEFTLDDFRRQIQQILQPGLMVKMLRLLPGMGEMSRIMQNEDAAGGAQRLVGIIDGMTQKERCDPKIIDFPRRNRIAKGAGVPVREVKCLLKQYDTMALIMKAMAGKGLGGRMQAIKELQRKQVKDDFADLDEFDDLDET
jgi:signal recognition particle subunit SRP54